MPTIHWESMDLWIGPWLAIFYGFAAFYLYTIVMLAFSKQKLLNGSYFIVFIGTGIADLLQFLGHQYLRLQSLFGIGPAYDWILTTVMNLMQLCFLQHVVGNFLLVVCQYVAVCHPSHYKKMWSTRRALIYIFVSYLICTLLCIPTIAAYSDYTLLEDGRYKVISHHTPPILYITSLSLIVFYVLSVAILVSRAAVVLRHSTMLHFSLKNHYKGMAVVALVDCVLFCIDILYELRVLIGDDCYPSVLLNFLNRMYDVFYAIIYLINPVLLVIFVKVARNEVIRPCTKPYNP